MRTVGKVILKTGTVDQAYGLCESMEYGPEAAEEKVFGGQGNTAALVYSDERNEFTGDFTPTEITGTHPLTKADIIGSLLEIDVGETNPLKIRVRTAKLKRTAGKKSTWSVAGAFYADVETAEAAKTPSGGE